jgi:hypothetical protein
MSVIIDLTCVFSEDSVGEVGGGGDGEGGGGGGGISSLSTISGVQVMVSLLDRSPMEWCRLMVSGTSRRSYVDHCLFSIVDLRIELYRVRSISGVILADRVFVYEGKSELRSRPALLFTRKIQKIKINFNKKLKI